jgi:excinuclease ABC subunit B
MSDTSLILKSEMKPAGDQPEAILALVDGIKKGFKKQTLLGATGTEDVYYGKCY